MKNYHKTRNEKKTSLITVGRFSKQLIAIACFLFSFSLQAQNNTIISYLSSSLDKYFNSHDGRRFKYLLDHCETQHCETVLKDAAKEYFFEIKNLPLINYEPLIVSFLTGVKPEEAKLMKKPAILYSNCNGAGRYYDGFGPEKLYQQSINSYLSALDLDSSVLCFSLQEGKTVSLDKLELIWYSKSEVPKHFSLYGISAAGEKILITDSHTAEQSIISGNALTTLYLSSDQVYPHYMLKLVKGGSQDRLLLRALVPSFKQKRRKTSYDDLLEIMLNNHKKMHHGTGVVFGPIQHKNHFSPQEIRNFLLAQPTQHCGNYSLVFVTSLPERYQWRIYGLQARDGAIHAVTEVCDKKYCRTADQTLGVLYPCTVHSLINGTCAYDKAIHLFSLNPLFKRYYGVGFFYGAKIKNTYDKFKDI